MDVTFRPPCRVDMPRIFEIFRQISDFSPPSDQYDCIWEAFSEQNNLYALVAERGGIVVGYGAILIEAKIRGGKLGHIEDIVTDASHRNCGIGSKLVGRLCEEGKRRGVYKIVLECKEHNVRFYENIQFRANGIAMDRLFI